ncbi:MAG: hypothetical protein HXL52_07990 [Solobacterium sp.]|nr:hypothetical protein [Solobacterium sp.]
MNHKIWSVLTAGAFVLSGCAAYLKPVVKPGVKNAKIMDGTYEGNAPAYAVDGEMKLSVTFQDNKIVSIETINAGSTASIYGQLKINYFHASLIVSLFMLIILQVLLNPVLP